MSFSAEETESVMRTVLTKPMRVSGSKFGWLPQNLPRYYAAEKESLGSPHSVFGYFSSVFGWLALNPSDEDRSEAILETYIPLNDSGSMRDTLPSAEAFDQLYDDIVNDDVKCIYVTGPRGCGKTAALNYFLTTRHRRLNVEEGITWFRSDASKIYQKLLKSPHASDWTLLEYTQAHLLFVALAHCRSDTLLKGFELNDQEMGTGPFYSAKLSRSREVAAVWGEIVQAFFDLRRQPLNFVDHVIRNIIKRVEKGPAFSSLMARVMEYIRESTDRGGGARKGRRGRVVQIIDGIDNIDRKRAESRYRAFLEQLCSFAELYHKQEMLYDKVIIVLRPETLNDLRRLQNDFVPVNDGIGLRRDFEAVPIDPELLFGRKCKTAEQPQSRTFKEKKQIVAAHRDYDAIWERSLLEISKLFVSELMATVGQGAGQSSSSEARAVLAAVFNDDLRLMCQNLINSMQYVRNYWEASEVRGGPADRTALLKNMRARSYVLREGSITGGRHLMPRHNDFVPGRWCPNLFHFELVTTASHWEGLCLLRLLQILERDSDENVTEAILQRDLAAIFHYSRPTIERAIATAWTFGLMHAGDLIHDPDGNETDVLNITAKGRFLRAAPFSDPAITYFMGASTKLHRSADDRKCFELHYPLGNYARRFVPAAIKTGITLLRHVISAHELEMQQAPSTVDVGAYRLPSLDVWFARAVGYCRHLASEQRNEQRYDELLADLRGIL